MAILFVPPKRDIIKMYQKRVSIRRSVREKQVQALKAAVRCDLLDHFQQQQKEEEVTRSIQPLIDSGNLQLLSLALIEREWSHLEHLRGQSLNQMAKLVVLRLNQPQAALILQHLLTHNKCSLPTDTFQSHVVEVALKQIEDIVEGVRQGDVGQPGQRGINSYLAIVTALGTRGRETDERFSRTVLQWMPWLVQNKLYLELLLKMAKQEAIEVQVVQLIRANLSLPVSLLRNILACNDEAKTLSLSLILPAIQQQPWKANFLEAVLPSYFDVTDQALSNFKARPCNESHKYLFKVLAGLVPLLQTASHSDFPSNCRQPSPVFLQTLVALLSGQSLSHRKILYGCLLATIDLLRNKGTDPSRAFSGLQLSQLWVDLGEGQDHSVVALVLKTLLKLVRCEGGAGVSEWLRGKEVWWLLEVLQFSGNEQVALFAEELLEQEFRQQEYSEEVYSL